MGTREEFRKSEGHYSKTRSREILKSGYHSTSESRMLSQGEISDDYYAVASDSDIVKSEHYKVDAKLRKRCVVVLTVSKELMEHERKRQEMYNEILQHQRRTLELRAIEKLKEKERRRLGRREEKRERTNLISRRNTTTDSNELIKPNRFARNYSEITLPSKSEYEEKYELRARKHTHEHFKELEPLNIHIEMAEATTSTLLSQIEAHLDKPSTAKSKQAEEKEPQQQNQTKNNDINQQTCDISRDIGQTKMRELNLLADIAQHLSPYQLDLPETKNPPRMPSPAPSLTPPPPTPTPPPPLLTKSKKEMPKEKVTVTEHLIIQSLDNPLEQIKTQLKNNDQEQQSPTSYAHEPKLKNVGAVLEASPCTNSLQNENQSDNNENSPLSDVITEKENRPKIQNNEILEQILEESISVLKPVNSPFKPLSDGSSVSSQSQSDTTVPILISNVETLNHFKQDEGRKTQNCDDKVNLLLKENTKPNCENVLSKNKLVEKESTERTKHDVILQNNGGLGRNESVSVLASTILESSIIYAADLANLNTETEICQNLTAPSLLSADLSDISLESEISKHLPEIAEPSPVVTDMSDNSNESITTKTFDLQASNIVNTTPDADGINEMSLPDLSLVMSNIGQHEILPTRDQEPLENNFSQLNCSLNTPIKFSTVISREEETVHNSKNELNTPLKFDAEPDLQQNSLQLKNTLEPETDNNVTKFLDLILNKTVTDAESETRDKIIKELNALTADTLVAASSCENSNTNKIVPPESKLSDKEEEERGNVAEQNKNVSRKASEGNTDVLNQTSDLVSDSFKSHQILECSSISHIECKSHATCIAENNSTVKERSVSEATVVNNDLNPPIENTKEENRVDFLTELVTNEYPVRMHSNSISPVHKLKSPAKKQTFNIKCRVRLKRLNIDDHNITSKKETWMAIPITKTEEPIYSNNNKPKCDTEMESAAAVKKPCLKYNNKDGSETDKRSKWLIDGKTETVEMPIKKAKLETEEATRIEVTQTPESQHPPTQTLTQSTITTPSTAASVFNTAPTIKSKSKASKTVTFDLSNLNEELRDNVTSHHKHKYKNNTGGVLGCYLKSSRPHKKLPDNTLRAAETLQLFVNTINDSIRTPPSAEFNKKRSPIKNKCIAEDETPRPPPASTLMGTPPCKKICSEKSRSQITSSKCQLTNSLPPQSISSIANDITTARIYTSSPLDQTLPEYDDNVDTVADSELILPTTTGSLRRKLKRPKKSQTRQEPVDDISTDDISNQPECNGDDDTDAVVDNDDDVFAEELLPIPAANEHILEEIVGAQPTHIGTGTVIRDDYMSIEATATVPVYLFNDESRDLATPEPIQSSDTTNVVDSSSYLNTSSSANTNNVSAPTQPSTTSIIGNLEKSMLSPSEHEVSSTQETFYQAPTKNKQQTELFGEKASTSKDKGNTNGGFISNNISKQKSEDKHFQNKEDYQTSSTACLLQNNQVDTTNHSPEMCTLALTGTTTTTTTNITSNRKIRKASTHDEILFNELQQQQLPSNKRKCTTATTFCAESTSDNNKSNATNKTKIETNSIENIKIKGSLAKAEDKFKKFIKEACKRDKSQGTMQLDVGLVAACNNGGGGGGSSPSTTTTIIDEKLSRSKRKKNKSSKSSKSKTHSERPSKIVLKASKLTPPPPPPPISANPLIITISKSRLIRPPSSPTPQTPIYSQDEQLSEFLDIPNAKLFIEKDKETTTAATSVQNTHQQRVYIAQSQSIAKSVLTNNSSISATSKAKRSQSPALSDILYSKPTRAVDYEMKEVIKNTNSTIAPKDKSSCTMLPTKKKDKPDIGNSSSSASMTCVNHNNVIFARDKYDLIKTKDKHYHHNHDQPQVKTKAKEKEKNAGQSKSSTQNNTRTHKTSSKEKKTAEKLKEKHKTAEKTSTRQELDNILKLNTLQGKTKSLNSALSTTATPLSSSNIKQHNSKSSKSIHSSSSSAPDVSKSKANPPQTQSPAPVTGIAPSQVVNATPSANNVRKKLKIK